MHSSFNLHGLSTVALICLSTSASWSHASDDVVKAPEQPASAAETVPNELPTISVKAKKTEARTYGRAEMDATPQTNRDLTSLISSNPAVRLNPNTEEAANKGSLAPEDFSIHGESPYQNLFTINGIGATNVVNPNSRNENLVAGNVVGFSQSYNLDTDLLDSVQVYDSNVPIEFTGFTGGVVDAKVKAPEGTNTFSLKRSFNSSNLTKQRIGDNANENTKWDDGRPGYSSTWKKHFTTLNADVRVTDSTNALFSFSRRQSDIGRLTAVLRPDAALPSGNDVTVERQDQADQVDNVMAVLNTRWQGGTESSLMMRYADRQEHLVSYLFPDSAWVNRQKSQGLGLDIIHPVEGAKLTFKLSHDQMDAMTDSDGTMLVTQQFADKSLKSYTRGGYGLETMEQAQTSAKLRIDWDSVHTGSIRHDLYAGLDLQNTDAKFDRKNDTYSFTQVLQADGTQFEKSKSFFMKGVAEAEINTWGVYLSDDMNWRNLRLNTSVRVDHDDFFGNTNVAPRTHLTWDAFGNQQTRFDAGWGRYYGANLLGYALIEEKSKLRRSILDQYGNPKDEASGVEVHNFDGVKTPYSDELTLGVSQKLNAHTETRLKYVRRKSENGLLQEKVGNVYTYNNDGFGRNETLTLSLANTQPWRALSAQWHGQFDFSWQKNFRNHDTVDAWESEEEAPNDIIEFNGQQIARKDKPSSEFYQPRRISASFRGEWKNAGVSWGNRINWNSGKEAVVYLNTVQNIDRYASRQLPAFWTWDMNLDYKPKALKGVGFNLSVLNVFNKIATLAISNPTLATNTNVYQTGRTIWLSMSYEH